LGWQAVKTRPRKPTKTLRKIFVDVLYGIGVAGCKKMDKDTFQNPEVARVYGKRTLQVKLDGEGKEQIEFKGETFKFVGFWEEVAYHEFAACF